MPDEKQRLMEGEHCARRQLMIDDEEFENRCLTLVRNQCVISSLNSLSMPWRFPPFSSQLENMRYVLQC